MSDESVVAAVSAANAKAHIEHITTQIPSRLAGSANGKRMAEYSAAALTKAGVSARVHEMPGLVSFPEKGEMRVLAPVELSIEANTLGHSLPTLADGISAELMDVASGAFSEYEGRDATGKITLSELSYHPARHEKQRISAIMGATGCVMMNWGHPENTAVPFGSVKPVWGNPTPETYKSEMATLPCIGIARTAGLKLREMLKAGPVRVWFRANVENGWRPVQITVGEVKGRSDDFVVVGGHQDSWPGPQATDNAAGNACILELARVFNQHRDKLRRGLVVRLLDRPRDRHHDRLVLVRRPQLGPPARARGGLSADRPARLRRHHALELGLQRRAQALPPGRREARPRQPTRRVAARRQERRRLVLRPGRADAGGPGRLHRGGAEEDRARQPRLVAPQRREHHRQARLHLHGRPSAGSMPAYLWELCTAVVLPFEYVSVADGFIERLDQLKAGAEGIGLQGAADRARAFKASAERLEAVAQDWRGRYAAGKTKDEAPADILNACMKRLSRALVPLASTSKGAYGHDPYGYTPQGTMIPTLFDVPRYAKLGDGEARWMLETQLVRDRNRIADALEDCRRLIDDTLARLA